MEELDEFRRLLQEAQGGSDQAARELLEIYGPHIIRTVRRRLNREMRSKFDSFDFAQDVWASFLANRSQIAALSGPDDLLAWLVTTARNKVIEEYRKRMQTRKHRLTLEQSFDRPAPDGVFSSDATPSQLALANELWDRLIGRQPEPCGVILRLRRKGLTHAEVAERLGIGERTVRRYMQQVYREEQS